MRNRSTEKDIRDYMDDNGFRGPSARFDYLELRAVHPPGWVQVFQFSAYVLDDDGNTIQLFGVARDDERKGIEVFLAESEPEQKRILNDWSTGLVTLHRDRSKLTPILLAIFGVILFIAIAGAMLSR